MHSLSSRAIFSLARARTVPKLQARSLRATTVVAASKNITPNVSFDTIAREWRCKWSADNDKKSLSDLQKALDEIKPTIKGIKGVKSVQRVVCGGCLDFKVVVALDEAEFGAWSDKKFAPEEDFLKKIKAIPGVSVVETQTYTLMPL